MHYDHYLAHHGQRRSRTRPDFLGLHGAQAAIAVEAKGRSRGLDEDLVPKAKQQVRNLPFIKGRPPPVTYVHVAYFDRAHEWCAHLADPPQRQGSQGIDPAALTLVYYIPIVMAIRNREHETVRIWGDAPYMRTYFQDVDTYLSVRADIADRVPDDAAVASGAEFSAAGAALYDLALSLDAETAGIRPLEERDTEMAFLGGDGVAVELGSSWRNWPEGRAE